MFNITCYVTMLLGLTNLLWKFQINKVYSECLTRRHQGNQRFSAQHYNQNYSVLGYQARSAPLVSNGRPARKAIILIIFYYLFKNNNKINHFNVLFDLLLPTAFAARRIVKNTFAYLGSFASGTEGFSCSGCPTLSPLGYDGSIASACGH